MLQAIIFDMDGVILDTEKLLSKYWIQAAQEAGFPMTQEDVLGIRSLAAVYAKPKLQEKFGREFDYETIRARRRELTAAHLERYGIPVKPGLRELLNFLHDSGLRTAVATATDRTRTAAYLEKIGVLRDFDVLVCGDMVTKGKPDPEIYLTACRVLGLTPADCMALEDSPNGIRSAAAAGCQTVMIPDLSGPEPSLLPLLTACVAGLRDVIPLLKGALHETESV